MADLRNALSGRKGQHWQDGPGWVPDEAPMPGLMDVIRGLPRRAYNAVPNLDVDPFSASGETPAASGGLLDQVLHYASYPARAGTSMAANALSGVAHSAAYPGEVAAGRAEPNIADSMGLAALLGLGGMGRAAGSAGRAELGMSGGNLGPPRPSMPDGTYGRPSGGGHADALKGAGYEQSQFEAAFNNVKGDAALSKSDLRAIIKAYGGRPDTLPPRASVEQLLDEIRTTFFERVYERDANAMAKKATPW